MAESEEALQHHDNTPHSRLQFDPDHVGEIDGVASDYCRQVGNHTRSGDLDPGVVLVRLGIGAMAAKSNWLAALVFTGAIHLRSTAVRAIAVKQQLDFNQPRIAGGAYAGITCQHAHSN